MAVVAFDSFAFTIRYPEFQDVSSLQLSAYFVDAGLYCDNTDQSRIVNLTQRQSLLWMLTAHIAALSGCGGYGEVRPVGRKRRDAATDHMDSQRDRCDPGRNSINTRSSG